MSMNVQSVLMPAEPFGLLEISIQPGTHTVIIDEESRKKAIISEFVNDIITRINSLSANAHDDILALAMGFYGVPLKDFFDNEIAVNSNDRLLAGIVRYHMERLEKGEDK